MTAAERAIQTGRASRRLEGMNDARTQTRTVRIAVLVLGAVVLLAAVFGVGWATRTLFLPPTQPIASAPYTIVKVSHGQVGQSLSLDSQSAWQTTPVANNEAAGVITSVNITQGQTVTTGTTLYTVNLVPVVVAQGAVPSFEAIASGSKGQDVKQLQQMLQTDGFYKGAIDGSVGSSTTSAIDAWQKSLNEPVTGTVSEGSIIYVPVLPTRLELNTKLIATGASVAGGESAIESVAASPTFTMPLSPSQADLIRNGMRVDITNGNDHWEATTGQQTTSQGSVSVALNSTGSGPICGSQCADIPLTGQSSLTSSVIITPTVSGNLVPTAALSSNATGSTQVVKADGHVKTVKVVESSEGMSVITGVPLGTRIRLAANTGQ